MQSMSQNDAVKVLYLIRTPPLDNLYGHLKNRLLRMYGFTKNTSFEAISSILFSWDVLPSALISNIFWDLSSFWRGKINISTSSLDPGQMWFHETIESCFL